MEFAETKRVGNFREKMGIWRNKRKRNSGKRKEQLDKYINMAEGNKE